jgi:methylmalonyl-CoA/ethylmalonyl-CoA epimerase
LIDLGFFGPGARFHHVGLVVPSIRGACPSAPVQVEESQGVALAFVQLHGLRIELLEPLGERSPIARNVEKGIRLAHICYEVPDLDSTLALCRRSGFHRLAPPAPARTFQGRRIVWVFSKDYGLFELAERPARPGG